MSKFIARVTTLTDTLHLERIPDTLNDRLEQSKKPWKPVISYLEQFNSRDVQLVLSANPKSVVSETKSEIFITVTLFASQ